LSFGDECRPAGLGARADFENPKIEKKTKKNKKNLAGHTDPRFASDSKQIYFLKHFFENSLFPGNKKF